MQKYLLGGVLLYELFFSEPFFNAKLYALEYDRLNTKSSSLISQVRIIRFWMLIRKNLYSNLFIGITVSWCLCIKNTCNVFTVHYILFSSQLVFWTNVIVLNFKCIYTRSRMIIIYDLFISS